ncbi:MAG TPA: S1/P1 nuclease [Thermoanaerobaculia bacterium]|nr:S1/P1 nuclease [Thermoanaerobaculia bacterium]
MRRIVSVALFLTLAIAGRAFAWGADGHVIVCRIAFLELENVPGAQDRVNELAALYRDPDGNPVASFAEGCKFPDFARAQVDDPQKPKWKKNFSQFNNWHFLNIPRETFAIEEDDCHDDCVLRGIMYHTKGVAMRGLSENQHAQALLFLGHWLGDIHQPLHISFQDDKGGNNVLVSKDSFYDRFKPKPGEQERPVNLHSVWDGRIIGKMRGTMTVDELAQSLRDAITEEQRIAWRMSTPLDWAQESYDISTLPDVEYCEWTLGAKGETCASEAQERKLTAAYQEEFDPVVRLRLQQAGVRLAAQIRKALGM